MADIILEYWKVVFYFIPFVMTYLVYRIAYRINQDEKRATHKSVAYSTLFYILGAEQLIKMQFGSYFVSYLLIGLILLLSIILIQQSKKNNEVFLLKGIKILWRMCFLLFLVVYLGLLIYNFGEFIYKMFIQ